MPIKTDADADADFSKPIRSDADPKTEKPIPMPMPIFLKIEIRCIPSASSQHVQRAPLQTISGQRSRQRSGQRSLAANDLWPTISAANAVGQSFFCGQR